MGYLETYRHWRQTAKDQAVLKRLGEMSDEEIENAFYKDLQFGTGGMRGLIDAGTNCLNIYTIAKVTQGICVYMKQKGYGRAAVSRDSRIQSDLFAQTAASVFAANGIQCFVTKDIMPTPFLSYMTREIPCDIGVMITASHNPARYNGYKVYNKHGYQLTDGDAEKVAECIEGIDVFGIVHAPFAHYVHAGSIIELDEALCQRYLADVQAHALHPAAGISVVYTPLNGTGYRLVPEILRRAGVTDLKIVTEQSMPDGTFPTCPSPNPEKREALARGLKLMEESGCDLLIATDPDADRLGVSVMHEGQSILLTGNETGVLLCDYLFGEMQRQNKLPADPVLVKTIVTTELAAQVAKQYGGTTIDVLTGFKYIGEVVTALESQGTAERFVLGFEESYGYLSGGYVRDKDAVEASMLVAEMAAFYKRAGKSLYTRLLEIYAQFGTYEHRVMSFEYPGAEGSRTMERLLHSFRNSIPKEIGGVRVRKRLDYMDSASTQLPAANVVKVILESGTTLIVRPSGTEPLIKFYITANRTPDENQVQFQKITAFVQEIFGG